MEDAVEDILNNTLSERKDVCKCNKCKLDMMAWALNRLPSKYVVTSKGRIYTRLEEIGIQFKADIIREVAKAIEHIKKSPRH